MVAEVYSHSFVPVLRGHIGKLVTIVAGGTIHQHAQSTQPCFNLRNCRPQGRDVGQIARHKQRGLFAPSR